MKIDRFHDGARSALDAARIFYHRAREVQKKAGCSSSRRAGNMALTSRTPVHIITGIPFHRFGLTQEPYVHTAFCLHRPLR